MSEYDDARRYLREQIAANEARLLEAADEGARQMSGWQAASYGRGQSHEAARRIIGKIEAQLSADRLLLAAVDRVEAMHKAAESRAEAEHAALIESLKNDTCPLDRLRELVEPLLRGNKDGTPVRGREYGAYLFDTSCERSAFTAEQMLILQAAAGTRRNLGLVKYEASELLAELDSKRPKNPPAPRRFERRLRHV